MESPALQRARVEMFHEAVEAATDSSEYENHLSSAFVV